MTIYQPTLEGTSILDYLEHQLPGYPFDPELDRDFVDELLDDFSHLDVLEQIKRYRWYHDNRPPTRRCRVALRRWIATAATKW
jgi:hypothetical protein